MTRTMYDSITVSAIPADAQMVAGYVDGKWKTVAALRKKFPKAIIVPITVLGTNSAGVVDIEPGDCSPTSGVAAVKNGTAHTPYSNLSELAEVLREIDRQGLPRSTPIWTAHYTGKAHLCGKACFAGFGLPWLPNVVATQYTDKALGRNLDASLVADYWPGVDADRLPTWYTQGKGLPLRRGMKGWKVRRLKKRLHVLGFYPWPFHSPTFGPGCEHAVKRFQGRVGIAVDGVCGPDTARHLYIGR